MPEWQPMETAPRDGSIVILLVKGKEYPCWLKRRYIDSDGNDCRAWEHWPDDIRADDPPGWDGGTCWDVNEAGEPSQQPEGWRPIKERE